MTTSNEFENFVYEVCKELGTPRAIVVHRNKTYHGRVSRRKISVDVSFDAQLLGARIFGLVECKCYKSRVGVSDVEEFHSKIDDIGTHKGIMFTTVGYQAGAKKAAKGRGIALFILREGQEPGEIRIERKSADRPPVSQFLRGNFLPWGRFSEPSDEAGYRVESADELLCLLAFSEEKNLRNWCASKLRFSPPFPNRWEASNTRFGRPRAVRREISIAAAERRHRAYLIT